MVEKVTTAARIEASIPEVEPMSNAFRQLSTLRMQTPLTGQQYSGRQQEHKWINGQLTREPMGDNTIARESTPPGRVKQATDVDRKETT